MMGYRHFAMGLAAAAAAFIAPAAANACVAVTTSGPGVIDYDPTSSVPVVRSFQVRLQENCQRDRNDGDIPIRLWFSDDIEPQPFGQVGDVPFEIRNRRRSIMATPVSRVAFPVDINFRSVSEVVQFDLWLAPGVAAESAVRQISLNWQTEDQFGDVVEGTIQFPVAIRLRPSFRIRMQGGGRFRELDFGTLTAGERRSVNLQAAATHPFRIEMDSTYGQRLRRARPCGIPIPPPRDAADFIRYAARLDGQRVNENRPYVNMTPTGRRTVLFPALPFEVRIDPSLDPESKRAGRYCDVITLSIHPAN